jgi:hypothetical protein
MTVTKRRLRNVAIVLVIAAIIVFLHAVVAVGLQEPAFFSGWLLLVTILTLAFLNARKKLPFLALSSVSAWLQFHVYAGWLSIALFVIHLRGRIPDGSLETTLAILFVFVAGSGVIGVFLSVAFPKRLTRRGEEVIFERIPEFREMLRRGADELIVRSAEETSSTTLADFYVARLKHLFDGPRDFFEHLFEMNLTQYAVSSEIQSVRRYLNDKEQDILDELAELVTRKQDLDYHFTLQATLKGWLFLHIPLTYCMLILAFVHLVLVYSFTGGVGV